LTGLEPQRHFRVNLFTKVSEPGHFSALQKSIKFHAIGFFSEADTPEFSSILIYKNTEQSICTEMRWHDAMLISMIIKLGRYLNEWLVN
jgi:hypothetical protein